ncbi:unnamed protein product [Linum tenue]|uniref:Uncharacterized protein n=1 Tax=Linum tenue TaxID=586396 RepID=A0AAV0LRF5_9ROSI|nr:unnamed protein product [Linum tenue]CAI0437139.1 unnamed protein product [Linum tenue]
MASLKFIQSHSKDMPFDVAAASVDSPLSEEQSASVELAELLLEAVERVGDRRFDGARTLLQQCDRRCSPTGSPIQRLVFYYSRSLRNRINRETGRTAKEQSSNLFKVIMTPSVRSVEFQRRLPFSQVAQFAGIQTILEHVEGVRRIHVLDLAIRNGHQWTILMQALATRRRSRVEHLKITAVATMGKELIEQTGRRLVMFAQTMNLVCSFNVVMVRDLAELRQDHLQFDSGETVVVLADYVASTLTSPAERLDALIKTIRRVKPCVMVVMEMEGNRNSSVFVNRFVESLFFAGVLFDCIGDCMVGDEATRKYGEETLLGEVSKIVMMGEGREWMIRSLKVDVWRAYFRRFGMVETQLSRSSMYQAELVAEQVPCWSPCTVWMDGKSLIVGWKGTPVKSITAWKFS